VIFGYNDEDPICDACIYACFLYAFQGKPFFTYPCVFCSLDNVFTDPSYKCEGFHSIYSNLPAEFPEAIINSKVAGGRITKEHLKISPEKRREFIESLEDWVSDIEFKSSNIDPEDFDMDILDLEEFEEEGIFERLRSHDYWRIYHPRFRKKRNEMN